MMQQSSRVFIVDTSCLIILSKIDCLFVIDQLSQRVLVSEEVAKEFHSPLPHWIEVRKVRDFSKIETFTSQVDLGEASSLMLAEEIPNSILILDDLKARKLAEKLKIEYSGTLGLLLKAKQAGIIDSISEVLKIRISGCRIL